MPDVNQFIADLGEDITETFVPRVEPFIHERGAAIAALAGPEVQQFTDQLVKKILAQQADPVQAFLTGLIQDLASRYRPEITGNLTTRIVNTGIEIESKDTKLELKEQKTGKTIASLDIPVFVKIQLNDFAVTLNSATVKIQDPQIGG
ncbi:MAG TPA: hypothetical protein VGV87_31345 [Blastocatellia bacterium]|jgi:hypothetical protein|nr:hypothetical protein [Blastocatellia bacterium]